VGGGGREKGECQKGDGKKRLTWKIFIARKKEDREGAFTTKHQRRGGEF